MSTCAHTHSFPFPNPTLCHSSDKFIWATDIICAARPRLEELEAQATQVLAGTEAMGSAFERIDARLSALRPQYEAAERRQKRLATLRLLTSLPAKLQRYVEANAHGVGMARPLITLLRSRRLAQRLSRRRSGGEAYANPSAIW